MTEVKISDDIFNETLKLEYTISQIIYKDNGCYTHFELSDSKLNIVTYNPNHHTYFLLTSVPMETTYYQTLKNACEFIEKSTKRTDYNSYTVQWKNDKEDIKTSFFWAKDIQEVLDKVHYKKDKNRLTIYSIKVNPSS